MTSVQHSEQNDQMQDYGRVMDGATLRITRLLPGTPDKIWPYLTQTEKCSQWLADLDVDLKKGGTIKLSFDHKKITPHAEDTPPQFQSEECMSEAGVILEYEPPHLLKYSWSNDSVVTFKLEPEGDKTRLSVTHSKLPNRSEMLGVSAGWHTHLNILRDKLSGQTPLPFWDTFLRLREDYDSMIEKE